MMSPRCFSPEFAIYIQGDIDPATRMQGVRFALVSSRSQPSSRSSSSFGTGGRRFKSCHSDQVPRVSSLDV